jgi:putative flippase GtrA
MRRLTIVIANNKTFLLYLIAGGLTTLVNYAIFFVMMFILSDEFDLLSMLREESGNPALFNTVNALAVTGAVIFAYVINKLMVFGTKCESTRDFAREALAFFTSRGVTMIFEIGACAFFVTLLRFPEFSTKLAVTVVVVLLNYILSVKFVFRKNKKKG